MDQSSTLIQSKNRQLPTANSSKQNDAGWVAQLVKLVELRVKELEVNGSSPGKEKTNITII
ncbi:hypothetical protein A2U01_0097862 [Trifolium medium]|nr:hypothetical protein [Trifolium medium]